MPKYHATANSRDWLSGDAFGVIIAGSDTTASTLVQIYYYLARYPEQVNLLRAELESVPTIDAVSLSSSPHLNGVINETLRLHPPVPSVGLRLTPTEGLTVGGLFIPGNTTVVAPLYSIHRRECSFLRLGSRAKTNKWLYNQSTCVQS